MLLQEPLCTQSCWTPNQSTLSCTYKAGAPPPVFFCSSPSPSHRTSLLTLPGKATHHCPFHAMRSSAQVAPWAATPVLEQIRCCWTQESPHAKHFAELSKVSQMYVCGSHTISSPGVQFDLHVAAIRLLPRLQAQCMLRVCRDLL